MWKRFVVALPLAAIGALWFFLLSLPWPILLRFRNPGPTSFMELRIEQAHARGDTLRVRQQWVPLRNISRNLRRAVIVAEDGRFYEHDGIDWQALREEFRYRGDAEFSWFDPGDLGALAGSLSYYRKHGDRIRGRSTITQQLAKNLYFGESRSVTRKIAEFVVAGRLERFLSKDRILELYLNVAEWGPGVFGVDAAARHYFGKSANSLTAEQAAALAATLPHPLTSNPKLRPGRMAWRKQMILARLGGSGSVRTVPLEPPGADSVAATLPVDTLPVVPPPDTVRRDTVRRDTLRRDTLRRDTLPPPTSTSSF